MLTVLSYGGGVQTLTLRLMIAYGLLPYKIDAAIMADTQREPEAVWKQIEWSESLVRRSANPSPLYVVTRGDLWRSATDVRTTRDGQRKYVKTAIPAHFRGEVKDGIGRRSCTRDFKIAVTTAKIRELLGKKRVYARDGLQCMVLLGLTIDEIYRVKPNPKAWLQNVYPLIDAGMSRADCHRWLAMRGHHGVVSSACVECPYRTDWSSLTPKELKRLPKSERALQRAYAAIGFEKVPYLTEARVPIDQITLAMRRRQNMAEEQYSLFMNECEGGCGT